MMPYHAYQILRAERSETVTTRRAADARLGEMAGAMAQLAVELFRPERIAQAAAAHGPLRKRVPVPPSHC
jgi:hypothetical protein